MKFSFRRTEKGDIEVTMLLDDTKLIGKKAQFLFSIRALARSYGYSTPLCSDRILLDQEFDIQNQQISFTIPAKQLQEWLYKGVFFEVSYLAKLRVHGLLGANEIGQQTLIDDKLFKVYVTEQGEGPKFSKPTVNYWKTYSIMAPLSKALTTFAVLALILCTVNAFMGIVPLVQGAFPLEAVVLILLVISCFVTATNYLKASLVSPMPKIGPDSELKLSQLIKTEAQADLQGITVEIVGNIHEKYQYRQSSKHGTRIRNADTVAKVVPIFTKEIPTVPKGAGIENYFSQAISFKEFFTKVPPGFAFDEHYGVFKEIEVFVRSKDFPDKKISIPFEASAL